MTKYAICLLCLIFVLAGCGNSSQETAIEKAVEKATAYIRSSGKPYFLVCNTYRFRAHSMFDAQLYRNKKEVEVWKERDPILALRNQLLEKNLISNDDIDLIEEKVKTEVQKAADFAEAGTFEPIGELTKYVYSS